MKTTRIGLPLALLLTVGCSRSNETPVAAAQQGLPPGFELNEFATGLGAARFMAFGPDGTLYVSSIRAGTVLALPDRDQDGQADQVITFAEGLTSPHGLAWHDPSTGNGAGGWLYVGETHRVVRLRDTDGDGRADQQEEVAAGLPPGGLRAASTSPAPSASGPTAGSTFPSAPPATCARRSIRCAPPFPA